MPIGLILFMVLMMGAGIFITLTGNKPKKERDAAQKKFYAKAYSILSNFFLTQSQMLKISSRLSSLSIYSRSEIQEIATKYLVLTLSISLGMVIAAILLFKDTVSILIVVAFALLVNNTLVTKQIDKTNLQVYKALKHSVSAIRQEYMKLGDVAEAIAEADIHPLLRKPFDEIHAILTASDGELRLLKFYESSPFRPLQTLAGICYNIQNYGDGKDEAGQSNFVQALTMLTSDINSELQRLISMKKKFGYIEYLPFVPLLAIRITENYFMDIMPGTALMYNGTIGFIGRVIILLLCIVSYSTVANINTAVPIKEDDRLPWINNLLLNPRIKQFAYNITPKNAKGRKVEKKLKSALSRKSLEYLYLEKVIYSVSAFVVAFIVIISTLSLSRQFILTSTQQLSLVATNEMEKYSKEQILQLDTAYINRDHEWTDDEFKEQIKAAMPGLTDLQILDQVKRIKDKDRSLKRTYFHWYYMLVIIAVSILSWYIPNLMLMLRKFLVQTEAEDDFLQLQTLTAILMNMEIDTIEVLWQWCQHSRIHKDILLYCYHSYPSNPEKELARLQSKTPIIEFKRFIGKLALTIRDLSLREAYSDLKIERDHMVRVREISINATIDKKRKIAGFLSLVPIGAFVLFELLVPLGYLGFQEFMNALGSLK